MIYILAQCGCKIGARLKPNPHYPSFVHERPYEKTVWFDNLCEMHKLNLQDDYINDIREEIVQI